MPLDRRITLEQDHGARNNLGEYVVDWRTIDTVWAERRNAGSTDSVVNGILRVTEILTWTIRYRADVAAIPIAKLRVQDADGALWNPELVAESDVRRRFLDIQAERTT